MKLCLLFLLYAVCFTACTTNSGTIIEGTLPSNLYDKQVVFWVPMEGEHPKPVDSTHVENNTFSLVITKRNLNKMGIVRVRYEHRMDLQDILVFTEPGTIYVNLDKNSSAFGAPLNETLQEWKEKKEAFNRTYYPVLRQFNQETDEREKSRLKSEMDEIEKAYRSFTDSLIGKNKNNPVGQFIASLSSESQN